MTGKDIVNAIDAMLDNPYYAKSIKAQVMQSVQKKNIAHCLVSVRKFTGLLILHVFLGNDG